MLLAFICSILYIANAEAASDRAQTEQVRTRLVAAHMKVTPGSEILIGLEQQIIPHWHTYWQNPGDSGMASSLTWTLPAGASAGPILWPVPRRFTLGSITNYGYAGQVVLLSKVHIPASALPGSDFPLHVKATWLVCEEVCIPQQAELGLTLHIVAAGTALGPENALIRDARAALPETPAWPATIRHASDTLELRIATSGLKQAPSKDVWFYPSAWGRIAHGERQPSRWENGTLIVALHPGESPPKPKEALDGVLAFNDVDGRPVRGFAIHAVPTPPPSPPSPAASTTSVPAGGTIEGSGLAASTESPASASLPSPSTPSVPFASTTPATSSASSSIGLAAAMLLAFMGGLILNLMPCVFPVLSIKALALVRHGVHANRTTRLHGATYTAGVVLSFLLLATVLLLLRSGGAQIGWGFQFQSPGFVLGVAWLMFVIGLSLSGVFTLGDSVAGIGEGLTERSGYAGSFFTGVLATVVATPCTAPFMGVAIAYALSQAAWHLILVFASLGLGLALPYLLLSYWPMLQRCLPKPGPWMERLKQFLAFPMYATALWLSWVFVQQTGADGLLLVLGGMLVMAFAAWLFNSTRQSSDTKRRAATFMSALLILATCGIAWQRIQTSSPSGRNASGGAGIENIQNDAHGEGAEPYSEARLQTLRAEGKPVFLNLTAAWCITCLVNERVALSQDSVQTAFKAEGIHYLKGDWTNQDAAITRKLAEFGRNGVPLYVFYPANGGQAVVLPQLLTPEIVLTHIHSAQ